MRIGKEELIDVCPNCQSPEFSISGDGLRYVCKDCKEIFEKPATGLRPEFQKQLHDIRKAVRLKKVRDSLKSMREDL